MNSTQFKTMSQNLLKDPAFADFTISCGTKSWKVHRAIIACHSRYFKNVFEGQYQETKDSAIVLKEDNETAVGLMIEYFYAFDYNDAPTKEAGFSNTLELHATVYVTADKYDVPDLKKLALKKFVKAAPASAMAQENPKGAIELAFAGTPAADRALRDVVLDYWMTFGSIMIPGLGHDFALSVVKEVPDFGAEIANKFATASYRFTCQCFRRTNVDYVEVKSATETFLRKCEACKKKLSDHKELEMRYEDGVRWSPFWIKWLDEK